jgi:hypothetical protein
MCHLEAGRGVAEVAASEGWGLGTGTETIIFSCALLAYMGPCVPGSTPTVQPTAGGKYLEKIKCLY